MKRILIWILVLSVLFIPVSMAQSTQQDAGSTESFEDVGNIDDMEEWSVPDDGGLTWDESKAVVALSEDSSQGFSWTAELDDETILTLSSETTSEAIDGMLPVHTFTYQPADDGWAMLTLYYEQADSDETAAVLTYSITVEDGKITDAWYEDLSDWGSGNEDVDGILYDGETGGVPLYVPQNMAIVSDKDGTVRLESDDGSIWMTIEYDPEGDPEELISEFEDEAGMEEAYTDEATGTSLISTAVDLDSDPPRGILVYETNEVGVDSIVEYTGYQAPNGGILMVQTGYVMK